jgi:OOP family OmpA-OmpF porin
LAACSAGTTSAGTTSASTAVAGDRPAASAGTTDAHPGERLGLPTVPSDNRSGVPQVDPNDAPITTRTTVLADQRPAVVVTLPEAVLFPFGSAELRPEAEAPLHAVVNLFRAQPGVSAEVAGHTDSIGSAEYNKALSTQRAAAVVEWLVNHGVPRDRLRPVGYGATRPVAANDTEDDRRRNRRVELTIS